MSMHAGCNSWEDEGEWRVALVVIFNGARKKPRVIRSGGSWQERRTTSSPHSTVQNCMQFVSELRHCSFIRTWKLR